MVRKLSDKPSSPSLVMIEWRDAISDSGWKQVHEVTEEAPIIRSIGWLVKMTRKAIVLAADMGRADDDTNRRIEVPRSLISSIIVIEQAPQKESKHARPATPRR